MTPAHTALLDAYLARHRATPFAWGQHDCCTFAAGWVQARTGLDPMAGLRGYSSRLGAARAVRAVAHGGRPAATLQTALLGRLGPCVQGNFAQAGDLVLVQQASRAGRSAGQQERRAVAVWGGSAAWLPGTAGLVGVAADFVLATFAAQRWLLAAPPAAAGAPA